MLRIIRFEVTYKKFEEAADSGDVSVDKFTNQEESWVKSDPDSKKIREKIGSLVKKYGEGFYQIFGTIKIKDDKCVKFLVESGIKKSDKPVLRIYTTDKEPEREREAGERLETLLK